MSDHSTSDPAPKPENSGFGHGFGYHGFGHGFGYHGFGYQHAPGSYEAARLYAWGPEQRRLARSGWGVEPAESAAEPPILAPPLRAVHVGPCLTRGGAELWLVELLRFLDPGRVRVLRTIATYPGAIDPGFVAALPIPHENGGAEAVRRAAVEADVLICWGVPLDELLDGVRAKLCVFVAHGDGPYTRSLLDRGGDRIDHVVAVSHRVREAACGDRPTSVIYNGVDAARLARTRPRDEVRRGFGFEPDDFVVGYVGRFSPEKRVHLIIEAVADLPAHVKVLMVGWGPLLDPLRALADERIPGRAAFITATDYLGDYYQALDAVCLLGTEEGFSLAMLEAMMCDCPLIVTPVGAVPELIVDRINGLVVAPAADAVRAAIERLGRHRAWARGLAAEARAFADQHGHAVRMARDYEDLLGRLWVARHGAAAGVAGVDGEGIKVI